MDIDWGPSTSSSLVRVCISPAAGTGRYTQREQLIGTEEAVATLTSRPGRLLGLNDRGRIAPGLRSELVLAEFVDTATCDEPNQSPPGVKAVIIAGRVVQPRLRTNR